MGATITDIADGGGPLVSLSAGNLIFVQVSDGCQSGVDLSWQPPSAAVIVKRAVAQDGRLAAVGLQPLRARFTLTLTRVDGTSERVSVRLAQPPSGLGPSAGPT